MTHFMLSFFSKTTLWPTKITLIALDSSLEFEITLKSISTYKLYTIFFLMTSALIWVHLLNDWKGRFGGLTPTGLAPPPIFGRKIVQFLHSQYLGQSQQKEKILTKDENRFRNFVYGKYPCEHCYKRWLKEKDR